MPQPKNQDYPELSIQKRIEINFNNPDLLHQAFIHRSFVNENPLVGITNERLEFLGDAILEFIVSYTLYEKFSTQDEGTLTALRSKLVNTNALAGVAQELDLGKYLYLSKGEEKGGGRTNISLLANTVEALIGAIYLDQGLTQTENFIRNFISSHVEEVVKKSLKDPKSQLQEFVQAQGLPAPIYKTISEVGPDHAKEFTVEVIINKESYGRGMGNNKQIAAQVAAENALKAWQTKN